MEEHYYLSPMLERPNGLKEKSSIECHQSCAMDCSSSRDSANILHLDFLPSFEDGLCSCLRFSWVASHFNNCSAQLLNCPDVLREGGTQILLYISIGQKPGLFSYLLSLIKQTKQENEPPHFSLIKGWKD